MPQLAYTGWLECRVCVRRPSFMAVHSPAAKGWLGLPACMLRPDVETSSKSGAPFLGESCRSSSEPADGGSRTCMHAANANPNEHQLAESSTACMHAWDVLILHLVFEHAALHALLMLCSTRSHGKGGRCALSALRRMPIAPAAFSSSGTARSCAAHHTPLFASTASSCRRRSC